MASFVVAAATTLPIEEGRDVPCLHTTHPRELVSGPTRRKPTSQNRTCGSSACERPLLVAERRKASRHALGDRFGVRRSER
jgi:hypothetical protein